MMKERFHKHSSQFEQRTGEDKKKKRVTEEIEGGPEEDEQRQKETENDNQSESVLMME